MELNKQLNSSEIKELKFIINQYNTNAYRLDELYKELESLSQKKDEILKDVKLISTELETLRLREDKYKKNIFKKYGNISLDIETLNVI